MPSPSDNTPKKPYQSNVTEVGSTKRIYRLWGWISIVLLIKAIL